jgi:hypothetical protein
MRNGAKPPQLIPSQYNQNGKSFKRTKGWYFFPQLISAQLLE